MSNLGWRCPNCRRIYSPYVQECKICNKYIDIETAKAIKENQEYEERLKKYMENEMKLIKEYDIPEDGDCYKCKRNDKNICEPFGVWIAGVFQYFQCQACKDWLKQQKESKE